MIREFHKDELDAAMQLWMNAITRVHPFIPRGYWLNQYRTTHNEHLSMAEIFIYGEYDRLKGFVSILEGSFVAALSVDTDSWNYGIDTKLVRWCQERYSYLEANVYKKSGDTAHFYMKHGFIIERELASSNIREQELFMIQKRD